jgi:hypothetical protein
MYMFPFLLCIAAILQPRHSWNVRQHPVQTPPTPNERLPVCQADIGRGKNQLIIQMPPQIYLSYHFIISVQLWYFIGGIINREDKKSEFILYIKCQW